MNKFLDKYSLSRMTQKKQKIRIALFLLRQWLSQVWFSRMAASGTPGNFLKCKSSGLTPARPMKSEFGGAVSASCVLTDLPGDSDIIWGLLEYHLPTRNPGPDDLASKFYHRRKNNTSLRKTLWENRWENTSHHYFYFYSLMEDVGDSLYLPFDSCFEVTPGFFGMSHFDRQEVHSVQVATLNAFK